MHAVVPNKIDLLLQEMLSHVWLNLSPLVRGTPSVVVQCSSLTSIPNWPRKLAIFLLALASASTITRVQWRRDNLVDPRAGPVRRRTITGLIFPLMGYRRIKTGAR